MFEICERIKKRSENAKPKRALCADKFETKAGGQFGAKLYHPTKIRAKIWQGNTEKIRPQGSKNHQKVEGRKSY